MFDKLVILILYTLAFNPMENDYDYNFSSKYSIEEPSADTKNLSNHESNDKTQNIKYMRCNKFRDSFYDIVYTSCYVILLQ